MVLGSRLGDKYGPRRVSGGLVLFTAMALVAATAQAIVQLLSGIALKGTAAALMCRARRLLLYVAAGRGSAAALAVWSATGAVAACWATSLAVSSPMSLVGRPSMRSTPPSVCSSSPGCSAASPAPLQTDIGVSTYSGRFCWSPPSWPSSLAHPSRAARTALHWPGRPGSRVLLILALVGSTVPHSIDPPRRPGRGTCGTARSCHSSTRPPRFGELLATPLLQRHLGLSPLQAPSPGAVQPRSDAGSVLSPRGALYDQRLAASDSAASPPEPCPCHRRSHRRPRCRSGGGRRRAGHRRRGRSGRHPVSDALHRKRDRSSIRCSAPGLLSAWLRSLPSARSQPTTRTAIAWLPPRPRPRGPHHADCPDGPELGPGPRHNIA